MKKILLVAVSALCLITSNAQGQGLLWKAFAMNKIGWAFHFNTLTEEDARAKAVGKCQIQTGSSCPTSISVPLEWFISGGLCNGVPVVAASKWDFNVADQNLFNKGAEYGLLDCVVLFHK